MAKKILTIIFGICMAVSAFFMLNACGGSEGGGENNGGGGNRESALNDYNFYFIAESDAYAIRKYKGTAKTISLPSSFSDGKTVNEIYFNVSEDDQPFLNSTVEEVTIPASITVLHNDENVFYGAKNLKKITVDAGNPVFASYDDCLYDKNLTTLLAVPYKKNNELKLPDTLKKIKNSALAYLHTYDSSDLDYLFEVDDDCIGKRIGAQITSVTLPAGIKELECETFKGCSELKTVNMSETQIETIESNVFSFTSSLENVSFPSTLKYVKSRAFAFSGIRNITFPKNVAGVDFWDSDDRRIGLEPADEIFMGCKNLEKITAPASLAFGVREYQGANYLENHPWNLGLEGNRATFFGCTNLKEIVINDFVENESYLLPNFTASVLAYAYDGSNIPEFTSEQIADMTFKSLERIVFDCDISGWLSDAKKASEWEIWYNRNSFNEYDSKTINTKNLYSAYSNLKIYTSNVTEMQKVLTYYIYGADYTDLYNRIKASVKSIDELGV